MDFDVVVKYILFIENLFKCKEIILMELFNKIVLFDFENDKFVL